MQKILGYVIEDSIVKEEEAKILTHINVAFGRLTMNGELVFDYHPFEADETGQGMESRYQNCFIHCAGRT